MYRVFTFFLFLSFVFTAFAGEKYFRFEVRNTSELDYLTNIISIDNVKGKEVWAYANEEEWQEFLRLHYKYEILPHPGSLYEHRMSDNLLELRGWDTYPTYEGYVSMMQQYAANYPSICRLDTFGYSVQGRLLLALIISDNVNVEEEEPEFFYTSTMHGDETVGYVLLLRLADYLLTNYGDTLTAEGRRVTHLVDNMEIWINPLFNPDGTYHGGNSTVTGATRYNANGKDLNRNFPDRITNPVNTPVGKEPETQAMMALAVEHNFVMSANFHGGAQVVNYPWDNGAPSGSYSMCPDDAWFIKVSKTYATPNPDLMNGGFPNGITNGCAWYAINGGRQDWIYYFHGGRETTIELWDTKNPPGYVLPQRWNNNKESFLAYMEEAFRGIRGKVTDASTGLPLKAQIDVIGISNAPVYSDPDVGDFYRLLLPGTYSLIVSAPHYLPDTLQNIVVVDSPATYVNVQLQPLPRGFVYGQAFLADTTDYSGITVRIDQQSTTTNVNGFFSLPNVFSGPIEITFEKAGYSTEIITTNLPAYDSLWVEATLYPASGAVLVIDDDGGERGFEAGKAAKEQSPVIRSKTRGSSANFFQTTLENMGYQVTRESSAQTSPATWSNYGFVVWSSGANLSPVASTSMQTALINYVNNGGNLIIEGGEIGYDHQNHTSFANTVLHITDWNGDNSGSLAVNIPTHPITANLPSVISLNYTGYGDQDAVTPAAGTELLIKNTGHPSTAGLLLAGTVEYMAFNIAAINSADAEQLIRNSATFMFPHSPIHNDVAVYGLAGVREGDMVHSTGNLPLRVIIKNYGDSTRAPGVQVEVTVSNGTVAHQFQGTTADSLYPGDTCAVFLGEWAVPDTLCEWTLNARVILPNDEVPSNNQKTVRIVSLSAEVSFTEDFESGWDGWQSLVSDTTQPWYGWDIDSYPVAGGWFSVRVLPAPAGTQQNEWLISPRLNTPQRLYFYWDYGSQQITNNTLYVLASTTDSLPASFTDTLLILEDGQSYPANGFSQMEQVDLSAYSQQSIYLAFVYRGNGGNYWALDNIIITGAPTSISGTPASLPAEFALMGNFPNPFNPTTTIRYALPRPADVELTIFNLLGQKVGEMHFGNQPAGIQQIHWHGENFASGIYIYRLTARDPQNRKLLFTQTAKMILVR